jgi:putative ABC transport system ATP-binding protein
VASSNVWESCALAHDPDVIIADEPTGNLDCETRANIMEILVSLAHEDGKCVIVVDPLQSRVRLYKMRCWDCFAER